MVEVTFTQSAGGSLQYAMSFGHSIGGAISVIITHDDGSQPTEEEIQEAQRQAEERERKRLEEGIPMEGNSKDVVCLDLGLSMGDLSVDPFSDQRTAFLQSMICINDPQFDDCAAEMIKSARAGLEKIQERSRAGEPVRCWYSDMPDELCGFYHLMTLLDDQADIRAIKLPELEERNGCIIQYNGWGDVDPGNFAKFLPLEQRISPGLRRFNANQWRELQAENAPLRAMLNGKLASAEEDLYDYYIKEELDKQPEEFQEARLIGNILGRHPLGVGDWWISRRIEAMIADGKLEAITNPPTGYPIYHRMLRKITSGE